MSGVVKIDLEALSRDLRIIKRKIKKLNLDIEKVCKNKTITEKEILILNSDQRLLERWVQQIAKETGIKLTA